jgi:hypothetical protein
MMNVIPKCECGADVHAELQYLPVYDDGGSVDCFEVDVMYYDECGDCYSIAAEAELINRGHYVEDELPF